MSLMKIAVRIMKITQGNWSSKKTPSSLYIFSVMGKERKERLCFLGTITYLNIKLIIKPILDIYNLAPHQIINITYGIYTLFPLHFNTYDTYNINGHFIFVSNFIIASYIIYVPIIRFLIKQSPTWATYVSL